MVSLEKEIEKMQQELITLAKKKSDPLNDPEIYERSCKIDQMIVEFMKSKPEKDKP